jgi:hypothetical protein
MLEVSPHDLQFKVVIDQYSTRQLRLMNRGAKPMAFKIKTTNPKQYFVRPNQGVIEPGGRTVIHVMMGKMTSMPKEKCKDRFLVQSAEYDGELTDTTKFEWKSYFTDPTHKPDEQKLKCTYITEEQKDTTSPTPNNDTPKTTESTGLTRRPVAAKDPPAETADIRPKAVPAQKESAPPPSAKMETPTPTQAPRTPSNSTTAIKPSTAPAEAAGPQWTLFVVIAILFFLLGRYTTHIGIPGLDQ